MKRPLVPPEYVFVKPKDVDLATRALSARAVLDWKEYEHDLVKPKTLDFIRIDGKTGIAIAKDNDATPPETAKFRDEAIRLLHSLGIEPEIMKYNEKDNELIPYTILSYSTVSIDEKGIAEAMTALESLEEEIELALTSHENQPSKNFKPGAMTEDPIGFQAKSGVAQSAPPKLSLQITCER